MSRFPYHYPYHVFSSHVSQPNMQESSCDTNAQDKFFENDLNKIPTEPDPAKFPGNPYRTHTCGELREADVGKSVILSGWVSHSRFRNAFIVLRDAYGTIQITSKAKTPVYRTETPGFKVQDHPNPPGIGMNQRSACDIPLESVIRVEGIVQGRPLGQINPDMATGHIEVVADRIAVLNSNSNPECAKMAHDRYYGNTGTDPDGSVKRGMDKLDYDKLRYRYAYLRTQTIQTNLRTRARFLARARAYLDRAGYVEVETPVLYKPTMSDMGAAEFIVPCGAAIRPPLPAQGPGDLNAEGGRTRAGDNLYYGLCQSPQLLKQLLMAGGLDRYYQVAKCFRNEKRIHHGRQPEFTQVDLEASFATQGDVMRTVEGMLTEAWPALVSTTAVPKEIGSLKVPFLVMTYGRAMELYGTDKPDLRFGDVLQLARGREPIPAHILASRVFAADRNLSNAPHSDSGPIYTVGITLSMVDFANFHLASTQGRLDDVLKPKHELAPQLYALWSDNEKSSGATHISYVSRVIEGVPTFDSSQRERIDHSDSSSGPSWAPLVGHSIPNRNVTIFCLSADVECAQEFMGRLRNTLMALEPPFAFMNSEGATSRPHDFCFLWVVDFPLFRRVRKSTTPKLEAVHHPFTAPVSQHQSELTRRTGESVRAYQNRLLAVRAQHYDLVCNGVEIGGGSVRIHDANEQRLVLENILGTNSPPQPQTTGSSQKPEPEFGYFLEALASGCPPHAGIALGLDRLVALARSSPSIQDAMAFPKSSAASQISDPVPTIIKSGAVTSVGKSDRWAYRKVPPAFRSEIAIGKSMNALFWWWLMYNLWYYPEETFGHYWWPNVSKYTDAELGVPPDDYPGTGRIRNKEDPPLILYANDVQE